MTRHRSRTCTVAAAACLAALLVALGLGTPAASAGTVPVFAPTPAPDDWSGPMGMTHPITVGGNYLPLSMGCGDPVPDRRILWYASGTGADSLWTGIGLPETGSVSYTSSSVRVDGVFRPFVGDFDGDACDDIFWYAPGTATDVVWYFNADGTHTSVPVRVDGTFTPVVGDWDPGTVADEIFWYAPGTAPDRWWSLSGSRATPRSVVGPQMDGTYRPVRGIDRRTIIWYAPGSEPDLAWMSTSMTSVDARLTVALPTVGTLETASIGGEAVLRDPATSRFSLVLSFRLSTGSGGSGVLPRSGGEGVLAGAPSSPVMSDSTYRAGFGVLHGPGTAPDLILEPRRTPNGRVSSVDAGVATSCAVQSGQVKCWGAVLATGIVAAGYALSSSHIPLAVKGVTNATQVAAGSQFGCALVLGGTVKCWGSDARGQRGDGPGATDPRAAATTVSGLTDVVGITAGAAFACALRASGEVRCWGEETNGELGDGGALASTATTPVAVRRPVAEGAGDLTGVSAIDAGVGHVCAVTTGGLARCWGDDEWEQLGAGAGIADSGTPVAVAGLTGVSAIGAGLEHTCARVGTGSVRCWGSDRKGQVGNGGKIFPATKVVTPTSVTGITTAASLSVGGYHTCVTLTPSGQLRCWGDNSAGQIGDRTTTDRSAPVTPLAADGAAVTGQTAHAGILTTCVKDPIGAVRCWGFNPYGGTGSAYSRNADTTPRPVPNLDGSAAIVLRP